MVQYGRCLSEDDHRNLRNFVIDLVAKKLLPHLNEVLKNLNEWVSECTEVMSGKPPVKDPKETKSYKGQSGRAIVHTYIMHFVLYNLKG